VGARWDLDPRSANGWCRPPAAAGGLGCSDRQGHARGLAVGHPAFLAARRSL